MLAIENSGHYALLKQSQTIRLARSIFTVMKWLCLPNHRNILSWLLIFLFQEQSTDTKRPYLFLHGPPNSGKTFFMNILAPPMTTIEEENNFLIKNRTFAHFGSERNGDYKPTCWFLMIPVMPKESPTN